VAAEHQGTEGAGHLVDIGGEVQTEVAGLQELVESVVLPPLPLEVGQRRLRQLHQSQLLLLARRLCVVDPTRTRTMVFGVRCDDDDVIRGGYDVIHDGGGDDLFHDGDDLFHDGGGLFHDGGGLRPLHGDGDLPHVVLLSSASLKTQYSLQEE
jgi:hypothetical protein